MVNKMKPTKKTAKKETKYGKVSKLLNSHFGINMDETQIKQAIDNMSLSDVLELDVAFDEKDADTIKMVFNKHIQLEYIMPNSGSNTSVASAAPQPRSYQPKTTIKSLTPSQVRTKKEIDQVSTGKEQEQAIADKEQELADMKKLAGIK